MDLAEQIAARFAWTDKETGIDDHGRGMPSEAHSPTTFDVKNIGDRKFLYNSKTNKMVLGAEGSPEENHAEVLSSLGRTDPKDYDSHDVRGHIRDGQVSVSFLATPTGEASTELQYKLAKKISNNGGHDHHTTINTGYRPRKLHEFLHPLSLRTAAPRAFRFDRNNPEAISWADKHAAELIDGISETTRDDIRELVAESLEGEYDVSDLASQISDLLGDDDRAELIARTESMRAANEGQQMLWEQAQSEGLLGPNAKQEWIVGDDEKLCPICQDMDGEQVDLDEDFNVDGEDIDGPPAHPNCRCTVALVP